MDEIAVDTSVLIDYIGGRSVPALEKAIDNEALVVPPLALAELLSGELTPHQRVLIGELLQEVPLHPTPLAHWIAVGDLRQRLLRRGLTVTIPDAHVAQCALDRGAILLTGDAIFALIANHVPLRLSS